LARLIAEGFLQQRTPTETVTEAMRREVMAGLDHKGDKVRSFEKKMDYPAVADLCQVIDADTRLVVVDKAVLDALKNHRKVTSLDLVRGSVQLWSRRIDELGLQPIRGTRELYAWTCQYDPDFLGYMAGVLPLVRANQDGFVI
jgi:hypothetical protein